MNWQGAAVITAAPLSDGEIYGASKYEISKNTISEDRGSQYMDLRNMLVTWRINSMHLKKTPYLWALEYLWT